MNAYVLIILILGNAAPGNPKAATTAEFDTMAACITARDWVRQDGNSRAQCFYKKERTV